MPLRDLDAILLTGDLGSVRLMRTMAFTNVERRKKGLPEKQYTAKQHRAAYMEAYNSTLRVVRYLAKHAPVYTIYGNVEQSRSETKRYAKEIGLPLPALDDALESIGVRVINNRVARVGPLRVGGLHFFVDDIWARTFAPGSTELLRSATKKTRAIEERLERFGSVDILLCHQPPYGILDTVTSKHAPKHWRGKHAGSKVIRSYITKHKPAYVLCGHIHEGEGKTRLGRTTVYNLGTAGYKLITV